MTEILLTVSSKGQVTIPAEVCRRLGVGKNQKIALIIDEENGDIRLTVPRYPDVASVRGKAGTLRKKLARQQIRDIACEDQYRAKTTKNS